MRSASLRWSIFGLSFVFAAAAAAACGSNDDSIFDNGDGQDGGGGDGSSTLPGDSGSFGDGAFGDGGLPVTLAIAPQNPTVDVTVGGAPQTVPFQATVNGQSVTAAWSVDRGELGSIDAKGIFTPSGNVGGTGTIFADYGGKRAQTSITVRLHLTQRGGTKGDGGTGAGGYGGVGGEGPGADPGNAVVGVLDGTPKPDTGLGFLYPYDKTVWPRGILAPLLQWTPGATVPDGSYDGVKIEITETNFTYTGYFATPTGAKGLVHHPVMKQAWDALAYSNAGEAVVVKVTLAKGGTAYGPITETWNIAQGTLKGTVYYNSYGTALAKNYTGAKGGDGTFGGATLAIKGSSTDPVLVAGKSGDASACRVCHTVSADGSTLLTQHGDNGYAVSSTYDLRNANKETVTGLTSGQGAFGAITPDGKHVFTASQPGFSGTSPSALYDVPAGTATAGTTGLPTGLQAATPSFSADGKHVAFNFYGGTAGGQTGDHTALGFLDFAAPANFSNFRASPKATGGIPMFPSWLPGEGGVVYEVETRDNGRGGDFGETRADCDDSTQACSGVGAHGELWWYDLASKTATRLDALNGKGYVPKGPNAHDDDTTLNYEPTVNPIASGGYLWVVFTSRRMYGNVTQVNPFWSDPRNFDLVQNITPKKLWVAAIDLNAKPGTDPSHPAFYLPAQELLAGNSRGYWVVDPCHVDGTSCATGDECCGGFCRNLDGGLVCSAEPPQCANEFDKCTQTSDCCAGTGLECLGGRCASPPVK